MGDLSELCERTDNTAGIAVTSEPSVSEVEAVSELCERADDTAAIAVTPEPSVSEVQA